MAHIDVKVTIWQRLHFSDHIDMEKIAQMIKAGDSVNDVCEDDLGFRTMEWLDNTETIIPVAENDGVSTIEVYKDNEASKPIWQNGKPAI